MPLSITLLVPKIVMYLMIVLLSAHAEQLKILNNNKMKYNTSSQKVKHFITNRSDVPMLFVVFFIKNSV